MMIRILVSFLLFLLFPMSSISAQTEDMPYLHITAEQGLSSSTVNCILMDRMGFMWIGTIGGLFRYDGYELKEYKCDLQDRNSFSHPYIQDLYEDQGDSGHIFWVGTSGGGLNRLNVETGEFKNYRFLSDTSNCLSNDLIHTLCPDDSGNIWIGTWGGGINIFNVKTEEFRCLKNNPGNTNSPGNDNIMVIFRDRMDLVWIGTEGAGLDCYDSIKKRFRHFKNDINNPKSLSDNNVWSLYQDRKGDLWIGTKNGLNYLPLSIYRNKDELFAAGNPGFDRFMHDPDDPGSIGEKWIVGITEDNDNRLWVGTYGGGLCRYQPDTKTFVFFKYQSTNKAVTMSNDLKPVYADPRGQALWVGTDGGGVYKHPLHRKKFYHIGHQAENPNSLSSNAVFGILEDSRNELWIANSSRGLDRFNPVTGKFMRYDYEQLNPHSLTSGKIHLMKEDRNGTIWIATAHGLTKYERKSDRFIRYSSDTFAGDVKFPEWIHGLVIDSLSSPPALWLGSYDGLFKFDYINNRIRRYVHDDSDTNSLVNNTIMFLYGEYHQGNLILWIGTEGGLSKFDTGENRFLNFLNETGAGGSVGKYPCYGIYRDQTGRLWIATFGGGIALMDEQSGNFQFYSKKNGLINNYVNTIEEDNHRNLWIGTMGGLSCFNTLSGEFRNYDINDGLLCSEFWNWSSLRSRKGILYFGGNNGIVYFHPDSICGNTTVPPVVFTNFQVFNQPVNPGIKSPLTRTITEANEIILTYDQDIFTIEFSALDYTAPIKNQYAYKLSGVNEDWVYTDASRRFATYTKLDPGEYIFRVKGSNNDGVWNEQGASIRIIILPPWYRSILAYAFYIIALIVMVTGTWKWQVNRLKNKHQRELEHLEAEKIKEIDQAKSRFFANISHEFRTPLTLIEGPVKQVLSGEFTGNIMEHCQMILRNTKRLLDLVNQLLDLSKLESGRMKLKVKKQDVIPLIRGLVQSFESLAKRKNIQFTFNTVEKALDGYFDEEKIERIINNLLSNAFKFTPEGGMVEVEITPLFPPLCIRGDRGVSITISNTGPGIPADKIGHIFDRFYQVDDSRARNHEGTGIGLALAREMVELHHGEVTAVSEPGKVTTFTVIMPVDRESYNESEVAADEISVETIRKPHQPEPDSGDIRETSPREQVPITSRTASKTTPAILIVDDNADVRKYIGGLLHSDYRILEAENGQDGLIVARDKMPDLIISDVMMPGMDGYAFCSKIKTNIEISHIPVILLTARAAEEDKLEGLEQGADDYITKPFEARELQLRVKNIIAHRYQLQKKFNQDIFCTPKDLALTSLDQKFMENLLHLINRQITDPGLNVEKLSRNMGMSRSHFERKVKVLFGLVPLALIRLVRLRRAKELLENNFGNVSQVAFEVGFNNLSYFSTCFQKQFGTHPSSHLHKL